MLTFPTLGVQPLEEPALESRIMAAWREDDDSPVLAVHLETLRERLRCVRGELRRRRAGAGP